MEISRVSRIKPKAVSVARWDVEETVLSLDRWRVTRLLSKKITSKKWRLIFFKSFFWWRMCLSYCHPLQSEKTTKQQPSALFLFFSKSKPKIAFSPSTIRVEYFFFSFSFLGPPKVSAKHLLPQLSTESRRDMTEVWIGLWDFSFFSILEKRHKRCLQLFRQRVDELRQSFALRLRLLYSKFWKLSKKKIKI